MKVLVTYGSTRGGTAGIAMELAKALREHGVGADCIPAQHADDLTGYDAVVVGGALYAMRWQRKARTWVVRNANGLRARPVGCSRAVRSTSPRRSARAPVRQVAKLMARVGARGHKTFGGRLAEDAQGFLASRMAKTHAGDWRNWDDIRAWAGQIAEQLATLATPVALPPAPPPQQQRFLLGLLSFVAATAILGGVTLVARPDGSVVHLPTTMLAHSPFSSFLVPGLLLLVVIGLGHLAAAVVVRRDPVAGRIAAFMAGGSLLVFMVAEMLMLRTVHGLQIVYLVIALATMYEALVANRHTERERAVA